MNTVNAVYYSYNAKSCPHDLVMKKPGGRAGHLKRQLYHRIAQLLILCPLLPENQVDARHNEDENDHKPAPPEYWSQPGSKVLDLVERRFSIIIPPERILIAHHQPVRYMGPEHFLPFIFR